MGKKKREHIVFDGMMKVKKSIPISKVNQSTGKTRSGNGMIHRPVIKRSGDR